MLSRIHEKLGTAGFILAIVALIAALSGGAYAAVSGQEKNLIKKESKKFSKQFSKNFSKKFAKQGPQGPKGDTGAPGPAGIAGAPGSAGAAGSDGKSVEAEAASGAKCPEGGTVFKIGGTEVGKACNGEEGDEGEAGPEGSPWAAGGTLPAGETETGAWSFSGDFTPAAAPSASISFPIPLASALGENEVHLINKNGQELLLDFAEEETVEVAPTKCGSALVPPATASNPGAAPGHLCVYSGVQIAKATGFFSSSFITDPGDECIGVACDPLFSGPGAGTSVTGAIVTFEYASSGVRAGHGSWAVTAPTP